MYVSARQTLLRGLDGGRSPRNAALAIALGIVAGFVAGWNFTAAALFVCVAALNVRPKLFAAAWAVAAATSILASGLTYRLGVLLLDGTPLGAAVGALGDGVFVALLDWDRYTLVGGAALGLLLSLPAAKLTAKILRASSPAVEGEPKEPWLRPYGLVWALAVLIACSAAPWTVGPKLAGRALLVRLAAANGAAVEAGDVRLSLWSGELQIDDLQLVDPKRPDRDRLRIGRITTTVSPGALLRGRFETERLFASQIRADVARRQSATAVRGGRRTTAAASRQPAFDVPADELELDGYLRGWPEFRDRLAWLGGLTAALEQLAECEQQASSAGPYGQRSTLGQRRPRVQIDFLRAEKLAGDFGLGSDALVELRRLSSQPLDSDAATRLKVAAPELDAQLIVELQLHAAQRRHRIQASASNWQLAELLDSAAIERGIAVASAKADLQAEGWLSRDCLELKVHLQAKSLDVHVEGPQRFAGVEAATWNEGLQRLRALRVEAKLAGTWAAPALTVDRQRVVELFKYQLRAAGEHELVRAVEHQLAEPAAAESIKEAAVAVKPEEPEGEFFTVSDEPPPAAAGNSPDGWHSAKSRTSESAESAKIGQTGAPAYPKTNAPDADPADALLARLAKPSAREQTTTSSDAPHAPGDNRPVVQKVARNEPAARRSAGLPRSERPLPGPINLVVGQYDRLPARQEERPQWPRSDGMANDEYYAEPPPQPGFFTRMATGAKDAFRRIVPKRQPEFEGDLPPEIDANEQLEYPEVRELGPQEPIDEALEQRPPARQSLLQRWFK